MLILEVGFDCNGLVSAEIGEWVGGGLTCFIPEANMADGSCGRLNKDLAGAYVGLVFGFNIIRR